MVVGKCSKNKLIKFGLLPKFSLLYYLLLNPTSTSSSVAAEVIKTSWIFGKHYIFTLGISTWPRPAKTLFDFLYTLGLLSKLDTETHLLLLLSGRRREQQEVLDMWELCKGKCPLLLLLPHCDNYFPTRAKKSIVLSAVY